MQRHSTVDSYIDGHIEWRDCLTALRNILLETELEETVKWGAPCYVYQKKLVVGIGAFKSYLGLWFHQGALLKDKHKKLINAQEGKTKALRQWRFYDISEIDSEVIKAYVQESIANVKKGNEIKPERKPLVIPPELQEALNEQAEVAQKFEAFSLSKKREYADHIAEAKRADTKIKRLEKIIPMIASGVGLHDKYKNC